MVWEEGQIMIPLVYLSTHLGYIGWSAKLFLDSLETKNTSSVFRGRLQKSLEQNLYRYEVLAGEPANIFVLDDNYYDTTENLIRDYQILIRSFNQLAFVLEDIDLARIFASATVIVADKEITLNKWHLVMEFVDQHSKDIADLQKSLSAEGIETPEINWVGYFSYLQSMEL